MRWQTIESVPATEARDDPIPVLLWIADGGDDGRGTFVRGRALRYQSGEIRPIADGHSGNWRITHWMHVESPEANAS